MAAWVGGMDVFACACVCVCRAGRSCAEWLLEHMTASHNAHVECIQCRGQSQCRGAHIRAIACHPMALP